MALGGAVVLRRHQFVPIDRQRRFTFDLEVAQPGFNAKPDDTRAIGADLGGSLIQSPDKVTGKPNRNGLRICHGSLIYDTEKKATFSIDIVYQ